MTFYELYYPCLTDKYILNQYRFVTCFSPKEKYRHFKFVVEFLKVHIFQSEDLFLLVTPRKVRTVRAIWIQSGPAVLRCGLYRGISVPQLAHQPQRDIPSMERFKQRTKDFTEQRAERQC